MPAYSFKRGSLTIEVWPADTMAPKAWVALPDWYDGAERYDGRSPDPQGYGDTPEEAADELEWIIREQEEADAERYFYETEIAP